ncbi:hypothetical protein E8E14_003029 [Neopestalotiopsis sp. 37M]|nr:hypothetical protein E8E14_003029 [Neopestalotiopsis sp. 37M]
MDPSLPPTAGPSSAAGLTAPVPLQSMGPNPDLPSVPLGSDSWTSPQPLSFDAQVMEGIIARVDWDALRGLVGAQVPGVGDSSRWIGNPYLGEYYLIRRLEFENGANFVAKIPRSICPEVNMIMSAEIGAMSFLRRNNRPRVDGIEVLPIPEPITFDITNNNAAKTAFLIIKYVHGINAQDLMRSLRDSPDKDHCRNDTYLKFMRNGIFRANMAWFQALLASISFLSIGSLYLKNEGSYVIGPEARTRKGPWYDEYGYCGDIIDRVRSHKDSGKSRGIDYKSLRKLIAIGHSKEPQNRQYKTRFQLAMPNFGLKDVLVDQNFKILGFVGFDRVMALPRGMAGQYPLIDLTDAYDITFTHVLRDPLHLDAVSMEERNYKTYLEKYEVRLQVREAASLWLGTVKAAVCQGLLQFVPCRSGATLVSETEAAKLNRWYKCISELLWLYGHAPETPMKEIVKELEPFIVMN